MRVQQFLTHLSNRANSYCSQCAKRNVLLMRQNEFMQNAILQPSILLVAQSFKLKHLGHISTQGDFSNTPYQFAHLN